MSIVSAIALCALVAGSVFGHQPTIRINGQTVRTSGRDITVHNGTVMADGKVLSGAPSESVNADAIGPSWAWAPVDAPVSSSSPLAALAAGGPRIDDVLVDADVPNGGIVCAVSSGNRHRIERIEAGSGLAVGAKCSIPQRVAAFAVGAAATHPVWLADAGARYLLTAWDLESGTARWQAPVNRDPYSPFRPWVIANDVLLTTPDIGLQCFSLKDGRERWRLPYPAAGRIMSAGEGLLLWAQPKAVIDRSGSRVSVSASEATTPEVLVVDLAIGKVVRTINTQAIPDPVKAKIAPETEARRKTREQAERQVEIERRPRIERELKGRAAGEPAPSCERTAADGVEGF